MAGEMGKSSPAPKCNRLFVGVGMEAGVIVAAYGIVRQPRPRGDILVHARPPEPSLGWQDWKLRIATSSRSRRAASVFLGVSHISHRPSRSRMPEVLHRRPDAPFPDFTQEIPDTGASDGALFLQNCQN